MTQKIESHPYIGESAAYAPENRLHRVRGRSVAPQQPARDPTPTTPKRPARPRKPRCDGWTEQRRIAFLEALGKSGCFNHAAREVGISRMSVWRLRERDSAFDAACKEKQRASVDLLRDIAMGRAMSRRRVSIYDDAGNVIATRTQIDDRLLMFLLNRYDLSDRPNLHSNRRPKPRIDYHQQATRVMPEGEKAMRRRMALVRGMEADIIMDELDARLDGVDELEDLFAEGEGEPFGTWWQEEAVDALLTEASLSAGASPSDPIAATMSATDDKVTYPGNDSDRLLAKRREQGSPPAHQLPDTRSPARHLRIATQQRGTLDGARPIMPTGDPNPSSSTGDGYDVLHRKALDAVG